MQSTCTVSYCHLWPVRLHIVPRCIRKQHDFQKNVIEHKMFVLIFPQTPVSKASYRKIIGRHYNKCTQGLDIRTCYSTFNQTWIFSSNFSKNTSLSNFMKICPQEQKYSVWTYGRIKLTVAINTTPCKEHQYPFEGNQVHRSRLVWRR
jgi:hypothetical protein